MTGAGCAVQTHTVQPSRSRKESAAGTGAPP